MKLTSPEPRTVILHYHLFKNAGTTIDGILNRRFPLQHAQCEGPDPWSSTTPGELLDFALRNPGVKAISSHHAYPPLPKHPGIRFLPIVFLRHPIDRFGSVYSFERRQPRNSRSPSVAIARNGSLADFARWVIGRDATAVCRNFQVVRLAGIQHDMRTARGTPADLDLARENLSGLPFVGLVESFKESMRELQQYVEPYIGDIDVSHAPQNVSASRAPTLEERLEHIAEELGPALFRELTEHNALDLLLYREVQRRLEAARVERDMRGISWLTRPRLRQRILHMLNRCDGSAGGVASRST